MYFAMYICIYIIFLYVCIISVRSQFNIMNYDNWVELLAINYLAYFIMYYARIRHALTTEMSKTFPSGGSMHARVKLEGIDGRAPQERGVCGLIRLNALQFTWSERVED